MDKKNAPYTDSPAPWNFGACSPLDPQLFSSIDEHAGELIAGRVSAKYSPAEVAVWLDGLAHVAESGSPALDASGNLIGLNFDRVWEGTMSDINYDPSICRNIMVDIRYVLFIIDKYAGAGHLVSEMKLVRPKTNRQKP